MLNVWAFYGAVAMWPQAAPWVVVVIVNAQNLLMLVCYARCVLVYCTAACTARWQGDNSFHLRLLSFGETGLPYH
jgi:hypothetical protein